MSKLGVVLRLEEQRLEEARQHLAEATAHLDALDRRIAAIEAQVAAERLAGTDLREAPTLAAFLMASRARLELLNRQRRAAAGEEERMRAAMLAQRIEARRIERLIEHQRRQAAEAQAKEERRSLDELVITRWRGGG